MESLAGMSAATFSSDFDPALPDLALALDPAQVALLFESRWPGPDRVSSISACVREHVRWSPGVGCVATYRLTPEPVSGEASSTVGVVEVGPEGVAHRLFTADAVLPGLAPASDSRLIAAWLEERLHRRVAGCSVTPVRYRPGRRCVLRYDLGDPAVLYGKVLPGGEAERLASTITALGDSIVPSVIGVAPEWQLVVQADAGESNLSSQLGQPLTARTLAEFSAAGRLLSQLHGRKGAAGPSRSLAGDAADLGPYLEFAGRVAPDSRPAFATAIEWVRSVAGPEGPAVPSHGAFRLDQVHASASGPRMIDIDSYCWSEPARDIGNLSAYLRWRAIRRPNEAPALAEVRDAFLSGYAGGQLPPPEDRRINVFEAASLLKIAGRRYRALAAGEWPLVPALIQEALEQLDEGRAR